MSTNSEIGGYDLEQGDFTQPWFESGQDLRFAEFYMDYLHFKLFFPLTL